MMYMCVCEMSCRGIFLLLFHSCATRNTNIFYKIRKNEANCGFSAAFTYCNFISVTPLFLIFPFFWIVPDVHLSAWELTILFTLISYSALGPHKKAPKVLSPANGDSRYDNISLKTRLWWHLPLAKKNNTKWRKNHEHLYFKLLIIQKYDICMKANDFICAKVSGPRSQHHKIYNS